MGTIHHPSQFEVPPTPVSVIFRHFAGTLLGLGLGLFGLHLLAQSANGIYWTPTSQRLKSWVEIKREIAGQTPSPKLILVGGSNVFYGLRAERLSQDLGLPAVNLATHGALPAAYLFHELDDQVKPGDIVLYAPEYTHYFQSPTLLNSETITFLVAHEQGFLRSLPGWEYPEMLMTLPPQSLFARWINNQTFIARRGQRIDGEYREIISKFGDYAKNRIEDAGPRQIQLMAAVSPLQLPNIKGDMRVPGPETAAFLEELFTLRDRIKALGATLLVTWPNTIDNEALHSSEISAFFEVFRQHLESEGIPVVGDPYEAMAPREDFFDTAYHLNAEGAEKRTARFAPVLKERLSQLGLPAKSTAPAAPQ